MSIACPKLFKNVKSKSPKHPKTTRHLLEGSGALSTFFLDIDPRIAPQDVIRRLSRGGDRHGVAAAEVGEGRQFGYQG